MHTTCIQCNGATYFTILVECFIIMDIITKPLVFSKMCMSSEEIFWNFGQYLHVCMPHPWSSEGVILDMLQTKNGIN